jgi:L-ribulose-5-phosphate 4-epimerase
VEGDLRPSSDLNTHLVLYRNFSGINGIVHTHSTWATIWAQAGMAIPPLGTTHADYFYGEIPCTRRMTQDEIEECYETQTGYVILEAFRTIDPVAVPGVLVNSHGPFSWGQDAHNAVHNAAVLEELAKMAYHTISLNPDVGSISQNLLDRHFLRKHGANAYYGQKR